MKRMSVKLCAKKKTAKILRRQYQSSTPLSRWTVLESWTTSFRAAYAMELPRRDCREASQWSRRGNSATSCRLRGRENGQAERVREEQNLERDEVHIYTHTHISYFLKKHIKSKNQIAFVSLFSIQQNNNNNNSRFVHPRVNPRSTKDPILRSALSGESQRRNQG